MAFPLQTLPATGVKLGADPITTYDGAADVGGGYAELAKAGWGPAGYYYNVSLATPMPMQGPANVKATGTFTATDIVVGNPSPGGSPLSGASTAGSVIAVAIPSGFASWTLLVKGYANGLIVTEVSVNSTNGTDGDWVGARCRLMAGSSLSADNVDYQLFQDGSYQGNAAGATWVRARSCSGMTTFPAVVFVLSGAAASYPNTTLGTSTASIGYVQQSGTAQWAIKTTDITASGNLTAAAQTVPITLSGQSTVNVEISGTWTGSLMFEGFVAASWNPVNGTSSSTSGPATTTTVNGTFRLTPAAFAQLRVNAVTLLSGTAVINIRGSTGAGGIYANQILPTKLTNGTVDAGVEPFGALVANTGYQTLFYDVWATSPIDTIDKWSVTGTTPGVSSGLMTMVATVSTYNAIQTKDAVRPNVGFSLVRNGISIETAVSTGAGRFWGLGTPATVPAAAVLAQNGIGYELDQATGALLAVTYAAGVRTTVATLTRPTDGATHGYGLYFRVTQAYWLLDGVTVASQAFPNVTVAGLPALIVRQNAAAFTGTPAFANIAHLTADTSRQGTVISDPVVGTRQARVNADGSLRVSGVAGGMALPVSLATNTPDVTDRAARLLGQVTNAGTFAVQSAATLSAETTKVIGTVNVAAGQAIASTQGTAGALANAWPVKVTDGTSTPAIKPASTLSALTDAAMAVQEINIGNQADASATTDTGTFSLIALFKRLLAKVTTQLPAALGGATSAASLPVVLSSDTASGSITTQNLVPAGAATAGSAVEIVLNGASSLATQVTGTYTGALSLQVSVDGTSWITVGGTPFINVNTGGYLASITSALVSIFQADCGAFTKARITALAAVTGTAVVTIRASANPSMVALDAGFPTGTNSIGNIGTVTTVSSVTSVAASTPAISTTTAATLSSAASTNATSVKASAGSLYSVTASNVGAAAAFLKLFNLATAPTVGTSVPFLTIPIPASGVVNIPFGAQGMRMATGIAFAITNLVADSDTTAIAAAQVKIAIAYI